MCCFFENCEWLSHEHGHWRWFCNGYIIFCFCYLVNASHVFSNQHLFKKKVLFQIQWLQPNYTHCYDDVSTIIVNYLQEFEVVTYWTHGLGDMNINYLVIECNNMHLLQNFLISKQILIFIANHATLLLCK
jgi:hypothetical protein